MSISLALGVGAVATATVAGASVAARRPGRRGIIWAAAAGTLAVIAGVDLLPESWSAARAAGLPTWTVPAAAAASFGLAGLAGRLGCACQTDRERRGGGTTAAALAVHRGLEGATIALGGSLAIAALAVHAFGEGLAAGSLLRAASRPRAAAWLGVMCVSPLVGATVVDSAGLPAAAEPVLVALAAGVVAQAARISVRAARLSRDRAGPRLLPARPAAAVLAAAFTLAAVHGTGQGWP